MMGDFAIVAPGETVCLLRPSGSGKSTLLRCINWLERPDNGRILIDSQPIGIPSGGVVMNSRQLAQVRTRIGMVFQQFALWPHLTVLQNVMEVPVYVQRRPKNEGMTMLVVTHEMAFAREAASRVILIDGGLVVETGLPEQFFSAPSTERGRQFLQRYAEGHRVAPSLV
jgi:ABC-type histidine transport system ATPase subunit